MILLFDGNLLGIQGKIVFCFLYVPPGGYTVYREETGYNGIEIFESKLFDIVKKYPEASSLRAGDFNARCGSYKMFC